MFALPWMCSLETNCEGGDKNESLGLGKNTMFNLLLHHMKSRASGNEDQRILLGQEVGIGFTLGVTSGFALKKAARTILFMVIVSLFPSLSLLSHPFYRSNT